MRPRLIAVLAAAGLATSALLAPTAVYAAPAAVPTYEGWNDYDTTLPPYVVGPTPFEVIVNGPNPVCSMWYRGTTLTSAPWAFTFDPNGRGSDGVDVRLCDGTEDTAYVDATVAFRITGTILYASDEGGNRTLSIRNSVDQPAQFTLTDPKGTAVVTQEIPPRDNVDIELDLRTLTKGTQYRATLSTPNGLTMSVPVFYAKGWAPMTFLDGPVFEPCSTLTWTYKKSGEPKKASGMRSDIVGGLNRLSKVTGLKFVPAEDPATADLVFEWRPMGKYGPAAMGGYSTTSGGEASGAVEFNTNNWWASNDRYKGFGQHSRGPGGRGWLVIHEVMHSLGLGHTDDEAQIMAPINRGQNKFGKGDLAGLQALYPKAGCPA